VSRTTCGTWLYTAPEVYKKEPYSAKVDQFAYSIILYELLQGTPPFRTLEAEEAAVQLALGQRPDFPLALSEELQALVRHCWSHEPTERPAFSAVQAVLESVLGGLQPSEHEDAPSHAQPPPRDAPQGQRAHAVAGPASPDAAAQPQCGCVIS